MKRSALFAIIILLVTLILLVRCSIAPFYPSQVQPGATIFLPTAYKSGMPRVTIYFPIVHKSGMVLFIP